MTPPTYTAWQMLAVLFTAMASMFALTAIAVRKYLTQQRRLDALQRDNIDLSQALQRARDEASKYAALKRDMLIVRSYPRESVAQFRAFQEVIDDLEKQRDN